MMDFGSSGRLKSRAIVCVMNLKATTETTLDLRVLPDIYTNISCLLPLLLAKPDLQALQKLEKDFLASVKARLDRYVNAENSTRIFIHLASLYATIIYMSTLLFLFNR